jgi:hypothetical protein
MSQRIKPGDILAVPLKEGGKFMYILEWENWNNVIFRLITGVLSSNVQEITQSGVLFITCIFRKTLTSWEWKKIWKLDIDDPIIQYNPETFIYDCIDDYFRMGSVIGSKEFKDRRIFDDIYDLECTQVYEKWHIEAILEYYCDTWFYHPRVWDFAEEWYCIWPRIKKYPLKPEHRAHAFALRKKYGIMQNT